MFSNDNAYISNLFKNNGAGVAVMFTKKVVMINNSSWAMPLMACCLKKSPIAIFPEINLYEIPPEFFSMGQTE